MTVARTLTIPPDVMARQVGDETVLLQLASGSYFGLDAIGTRFWQLLGERKQMPEIIGLMLAEYEVQREDLERDLDRLVQELLQQGLVSVN
jgi:hypothetical protein